MALIKSIELENGITVNYHRVASVNNITNISSIIEVASYTSKAKRNEEKEKISSGQPMDIYIETRHIPVPYNEEFNVVEAYEYLKETEKYEGSKDD